MFLTLTLSVPVIPDFGNLLDHGIRIVVILGAAYLAAKILNKSIPTIRVQIIDRMKKSGRADIEVEKRAATLSGILRKAVVISIWLLAIVMALKESGFDIGPLLAGAGVVGLAVGFGAQNLVRDVISGMFLLLENQIRVNDVAVINGTGGLVEAINLRTTVLRGLDGTVAAVAPAVRPGGHVVVGGPFWRSWPLPDDVDDLGYVPLRETAGRFEAAGLPLVTLIAASEDDWDTYESLHWRALEEWLAANPDDAAAAAYVVWGRDLVPDTIPLLGGIDDVIVVMLAVDLFLDGVPDLLLAEKLDELGIERSAFDRDIAQLRRVMPRPVRRLLRDVPRVLDAAIEFSARAGRGVRLLGRDPKEDPLA